MHETRPTAAATQAARRRGRIKMLAILAVCAAPVIASYLSYYVIKPAGRTNYGELLDPQRDVSGVQAVAPDARTLTLGQFRGKWVMLTADSGACDARCETKLVAIRQVRLTTGKDKDRIERLLLLTDDTTPAPRLVREHEGMHVARIGVDAARAALPAADGGEVSDHVFLVDPLGNLMMRFPKDADPNRMKKDIAKLLRASRVG